MYMMKLYAYDQSTFDCNVFLNSNWTCFALVRASSCLITGFFVLYFATLRELYAWLCIAIYEFTCICACASIYACVSVYTRESAVSSHVLNYAITNVWRLIELYSLIPGLIWCISHYSIRTLAPVPLSIFRSNSKFDENSECSSFEYTRPITTIFCTRHDSDTVVTCAKYRCDRPRILYTRVFWIFIEFRIRSKYA